MVFRYRSGYLQWDILDDAAVAAHVGRQCSLQVAMVVGTQRRIVVINRNIVLRQIRLELYRRLFIWIVKVFRLHFYAPTKKRERGKCKSNTEQKQWNYLYFQLKIFTRCNCSVFVFYFHLRRSFIGRYRRIVCNEYDSRGIHCIECENWKW